MPKRTLLCLTLISLLIVANFFSLVKIFQLKKEFQQIEQKQQSLTNLNQLLNNKYTSFFEEVPEDWQTYRNEKYGFEIRYPSKLRRMEGRIEEDIKEMGTCEIVLRYSSSPDSNVEKDMMSICINPVEFISEEIEINNVFQNWKNEWAERIQAKMINETEVILSPEIKAHKVSFFTKSYCIDAPEIFSEGMDIFYNIPSYTIRNLVVSIFGRFSIGGIDQPCPPSEPISLYDLYHMYKNELQNLILFDQIVATFKFLK